MVVTWNGMQKTAMMTSEKARFAMKRLVTFCNKNIPGDIFSKFFEPIVPQAQRKGGRKKLWTHLRTLYCSERNRDCLNPVKVEPTNIGF